MKNIRIVVIDDHHLVRAGILSLLSDHNDIEVVGDTGISDEAVRLVSGHPARCRPARHRHARTDRLSVDPGHCRRRRRKAKIIILSMHDTQEHVNSALRLGAHGYIVKTAAPEELNFTIRRVLAGRTGAAGLGIPRDA
jgi:DNA-binding NarL/FixJ family response regulator